MPQDKPSSNASDEQKLARVLRRTAAVLFVEAAAVGLFAAYLLWGLVTGQAKIAAAEITLSALFAAAAVWVWYIGVSLTRGKRWARSAAIFWQTCQLFIASQSFTGRGANWFIGTTLIATSIWVLANLFSKTVIRDSQNEVGSGD